MDQSHPKGLCSVLRRFFFAAQRLSARWGSACVVRAYVRRCREPRYPSRTTGARLPKPHHGCQVPLTGRAHVRISLQVCGVSQLFHCARSASCGRSAKYVCRARKKKRLTVAAHRAVGSVAQGVPGVPGVPVRCTYVRTALRITVRTYVRSRTR